MQYSYSTVKVKVTLWGADTEYHSSISFGTSLELVSHSDILSHLAKHIGTYKFKSTAANTKINNAEYILALSPTCHV